MRSSRVKAPHRTRQRAIITESPRLGRSAARRRTRIRIRRRRHAMIPNTTRCSLLTMGNFSRSIPYQRRCPRTGRTIRLAAARLRRHQHRARTGFHCSYPRTYLSSIPGTICPCKLSNPPSQIRIQSPTLNTSTMMTVWCVHKHRPLLPRIRHSSRTGAQHGALFSGSCGGPKAGALCLQTMRCGKRTQVERMHRTDRAWNSYHPCLSLIYECSDVVFDLRGAR